MTFAVINTGGKQYKVFANDEVVIEKLPNKVGDVIQFKEVLLLNNNDNVEIGTPNITGAKVEAKVLQQRKNKTILVFKKRRRQNSKRKNGHRQNVSLIQITKIFGKDGKVVAENSAKNKKDKVKQIETVKKTKAK
ncbi:MAG: 50S ribosomal protein L21 [Candidatus Pelagibacter sp.]|nr:50S ribosomal protein L21 [Candidatus Pelagibacter sp.]|tara:strand:+ start:55452 stop:55856 length:405 start_codon:yes stop_codon:yes gene_type:complete